MMNKLTAEVARRNIHLLKEIQAAPNIGLSMRSEIFLQALEIALPVLEQQEKEATPQIDNDVWIEWGGGKQPVPSSTPVEVRFRNGATNREDSAGGWNWECTSDDPRYYDIIAYRVIEMVGGKDESNSLGIN